MSQAIGISFGPAHITVSKAGDGDSFSNIASHPASPGYQEFFQQILQKRVQSDLNSRPREELPETYLIPPRSQSNDIETMLRLELEAVLERIPHTAANIVPTITIPYHWNIILQRAAYKAAEAAQIPLASNHMLYKMSRAVEKAYDLDKHITLDDYFFLIVDYNVEYLHLFMCETAKGGGYGIVEGQVQLALLGEDSGWREADVVDAVERFVAITTVEGEVWVDVKPPVGLVKAVLLGGDASVRGMGGMGEVLRRVFGGGMVRDSYDPLFVGAIGAARGARRQREDPKSDDDFICAPIEKLSKG